MADLNKSELIKTEETFSKLPQNSSVENHLFTTSMLEEEKKLIAEGSLASDLVTQDGLAQWQHISEDMRMNQLQHLLDKSSIYANYLLGVIEKDKEKQKRRAERRQKKHLKEQQNLSMNSTINSKQQNAVPNLKVTRKRKKNSIDETFQSPAKVKKVIKSNQTEKVESTTSNNCSHPRPKLEVGCKVKVVYKLDNSEDDLHEGKILDICNVNKEWKYLIHFAGRKKSDDKWVCKTAIISDINDDSDEENNNQASLAVTKKEKEIAKIDSQALFQSKLYLGKHAENDIKFVHGVKYLNEKVIPDSQPVLLTGGILRDYQIAGYEWLKILFDNAVNGILADEMGLGKTIQCIALISRLVKLGFPGPYMVCAPMSTICNWFTEFNRFSPQIPVMLYHGSAAERHILQPKIGEKSENLMCCPVVVTSYEILIRDSQSLAKHSWDYLVIDEGHRLKNMNCRLIKELRKLKVNAKLLLTGTPLQNNLTELWSLLNFLLPEVFNDLSTFEAWFDLDKIQNGTQLIDSGKEKNVILMLHKILAPFLLRRTKADVSLSLPPKKELLVFVPLSQKQSEFYQALTNQTIMQYLKNKGSEKKNDEDVDCHKKFNGSNENKINFTAHKTRSSTLDYRITQQREKSYFQDYETSVIKVSLNNVAMQLRKCCNHPYLIEYPLIPGTDIYRVDEDIVSSCGKLELLDRMLPVLQNDGHKVLIFSQMTKILDILEDYCRFRSYSYVRLDGSTKCTDRKIMIDEYNNDSDMFMFLLSTRAGGLGINLTAADTVIIYDSDWNPQNDLQAQDRCHRIGQTRPVIVYRLVAANTVDQFMVERAETKRVLERVVMNRSKFKGKLQEDITSDQFISGESMSILKMLQASVGKDKCAVKPISENNLLKILDRDQLLKTSDVNIGCGIFRSLD